MINIIQDKWDQILEKMKIEHEISDAAFKTWVQPLTVDSVIGNVVYVSISDELASGVGIDYIIKKYKLPLQVTISECLTASLMSKSSPRIQSLNAKPRLSPKSNKNLSSPILWIII